MGKRSIAYSTVYSHASLKGEQKKVKSDYAHELKADMLKWIQKSKLWTH